MNIIYTSLITKDRPQKQHRLSTLRQQQLWGCLFCLQGIVRYFYSYLSDAAHWLFSDAHAAPVNASTLEWDTDTGYTTTAIWDNTALVAGGESSFWVLLLEWLFNLFAISFAGNVNEQTRPEHIRAEQPVQTRPKQTNLARLEPS